MSENTTQKLLCSQEEEPFLLFGIVKIVPCGGVFSFIVLVLYIIQEILEFDEEELGSLPRL